MRSTLLLFAVAASLLAGVGGKLAYIQATQGPELQQRAEKQQHTRYEIPALRGAILDTCGRALAQSTRSPGIFADPSLIQDPAFAAYSVAPLFGLDPAALEKLLRERSADRFVWVKREVSDPELAAFNAVRSARRLEAFNVQYDMKRAYPCGRAASQVIGFVGVDPTARAGIELLYDSQLTGTPGWRSSTVDVHRHRVFSDEEDYRPPEDGASVVLTLDTYIQQIVETALRDAVEKYKVEWGAAVVLDPHSGEVLAMSSMPDFDPADPLPGKQARAAEEENLRNRCIAFSIEPGSIYKPFIASLAVDEGQTRLDEVFAINGPSRRFGARTINDTHPHGSLTVHEIISQSSNIGMGLLGGRLGNDRLYRYVRLFGFGDPTGIELPGEHPGLLNDISNWTSFSTQSIPIGQEIGVTQIQIATAFGAFCNGGFLVRPRIVRGIVSAEGATLLDSSRPIVLRRVLSEETAYRFRMEALVETVTRGTAQHSADLPDHQAFGKTGTAQIARRDGRGYEPKKYCSSFVGSAPSDHPRVVVLVTMYKPGGGQYYGSQVAAPVFKEIMSAVLTYLQVPPEPKQKVESKPAMR